MKRFFQILFVVIAIVFFGSILLSFGGMIALINPPDERVEKSSILALDLEGIIMDAKEPLEMLRKYRKDDRIKGVLVRINSPGGVVGPSQELFDELKRTRTEFKKPVIAFCSAVAASGAYYAAVGAEKIYTTPGCMMGSIGVIMEFVNLAGLYDWAKIHRYSLSTGKYKDAGAEYKPLTDDQRALFQDLIQDVLAQFKEAIIEGRSMEPEVLDKYADGRVFTGAQAVKLGFADKVGTWNDALKELGEMTGLGPTPDVFKARRRRGLVEFFDEASSETRMLKMAQELLKTELNAQPLLLLPGAITW